MNVVLYALCSVVRFLAERLGDEIRDESETI